MDRELAARPHGLGFLSASLPPRQVLHRQPHPRDTRDTRAPLTSIQNTPNLLADAFCQTNFVGDDGDCPSRVCVRLLGHDDARTGDAVLRYHALLLARP